MAVCVYSYSLSLFASEHWRRRFTSHLAHAHRSCFELRRVLLRWAYSLLSLRLCNIITYKQINCNRIQCRIKYWPIFITLKIFFRRSVLFLLKKSVWKNDVIFYIHEALFISRVYDNNCIPSLRFLLNLKKQPLLYRCIKYYLYQVLFELSHPSSETGVQHFWDYCPSKQGYSKVINYLTIG